MVSLGDAHRTPRGDDDETLDVVLERRRSDRGLTRVPWLDAMEPRDAPAWPARVPEHHVVRAIVGSAPDGRRDPETTPASAAAAGPQAYLVENGSARRTLRIHFHLVDQFQLVVDGDATIGRSELRRGVVHYADRHTPYGPLRYGSAGLAYLTLRAATDTGASYMPDAAAELAATFERDGRDASTRRNLTRDLGHERHRAAPRPEEGWVDVVAAEDGLRISVVDLPGGETAPRTTVAGAGAFGVVLAGAVDDGRVHGPGALVWCPPGTEPVVSAGSAGTRVALLQLPRPATVPTDAGTAE